VRRGVPVGPPSISLKASSIGRLEKRRSASDGRTLAIYELKHMTASAKNRIMIFGPKSDGTYVVEFRTSKGESLAISARGETAVLQHFQAQMPYGLFVPDVP
jgi:hypothetical protein